jgi:ribulose-5-phosphate 4-epimerase/fuculose-1-phosphate aldolase
MSAQLKPSTASPLNCSPEEWAARQELACCYRAVEHMGWHRDSIYNHISMRSPGPDAHFLINPFGLMYQEVNASNLLKVDLQGEKVVPSPWPVFAPGFVVHASVHRVREDLKCVIHTHSFAGMAVSAQEQGLLPLTLASMGLQGRVAYYDCDGITDDPEECERIAAALGTKNAMILRNHGLLAAGDTVGQAFALMRKLEESCAVQVMAQAGGAKLNIPPRHIVEKIAKTAAQSIVKPQLMGADKDKSKKDVAWDAMRRLMDQLHPDYRN